MKNNQLLHTPEGVRDIYNDECADKLTIQYNIHNIFKKYGYKDIQTPSFEFFDVFNKERGSVASSDMFKFCDNEGNTLVLRPDFTPGIARSAAKYFDNEKSALRLCYTGNTFVNNPRYQGRLKEMTESGLELIGDSSIEADAEVLSVAIEALLSLGLENFQVELGNVAFCEAAANAAGLDDKVRNKLFDMIRNKNLFLIENMLKEEGVSDKWVKVLSTLPQLFGSSEVLRSAKELSDDENMINSIVHLEKLLDILKEKGFEKYVSFDLSMLSNLEYYTGIIFKAYTYEVGEEILNGGRYDKLMGQFGSEKAAIGFSFKVDSLCLANSRQNEKKNEGRYVTFALAKGRLAKKAMELLEQIGIFCEEMKDEKTRKLIFVNEEYKLKFFLAKASDVPTYVEYGAADIGIVGRDTILEENRKLYEVYDLQMGKCRMCVCGKPEARELLSNHELIRVASKYPHIAKDYFNNVKNQTVEIIKLNGSVELAPIVGLSEVIVDIVETGATLRENGLTVLEEVCDLSARIVVNQVSMKLENKRINDIINALKKLREEA